MQRSRYWHLDRLCTRVTHGVDPPVPSGIIETQATHRLVHLEAYGARGDVGVRQVDTPRCVYTCQPFYDLTWHTKARHVVHKLDGRHAGLFNPEDAAYVASRPLAATPDRLSQLTYVGIESAAISRSRMKGRFIRRLYPAEIIDGRASRAVACCVP